MIKAGQRGWYNSDKVALTIRMGIRLWEKVLSVVKIAMITIWECADSVYHVEEPLINMEVKYQLIKVGRIGKVSTIINALVK